MPKRSIIVYLPKEVKAELDKIAKEEGIAPVDFNCIILRLGLKCWKRGDSLNG